MEILNEEDPQTEKDLQELREIQQRSARLIALIENGTDIPAVSVRLQELAEKEKALRQKITEARRNEIDMNTVREFLSSMADITSLPREKQKEIINRAIEKIKVSENAYTAEFRIRLVAGADSKSYLILPISFPRN